MRVTDRNGRKAEDVVIVRLIDIENANSHERLSETLDEKSAALAASLNEGQSRLQDTLDSRSESFLSAVSTTHDRLSETLDDRAMALAISLNESQSRLEETLTSGADAITQAVSGTHAAGRLS